jgi:CRISPR/Cas system CMR-associated protein Cmr5 small subunit
VTLPARLDHGLARRAAQTIDTARDEQTGRLPDPVITRLKGLPALLRTSGPLATLAFFAAKAGDRNAVARAYKVVGAALREQAATELGSADDAGGSLGAFILDLTAADVTADQLARMTARLEAFTLWLRRLAEAVEQEQDRGRSQAMPTRGDEAGDALLAPGRAARRRRPEPSPATGPFPVPDG